MENIAHNIRMARFAAALGEYAQALEICAAALAQLNSLPAWNGKPALASSLFRIMNKLRGKTRRQRKIVKNLHV